VFMGTAATLRALHTDTMTIGMDPEVTVCYLIGTWAFWLGFLAFVYGFVNLAYVRLAMFWKDSSSSKRFVIKQLKSVTFIAGLLITVVCIAPMGMLATTDPNRYFVFGAIHYLGLSILTILAGTLIPQFCRKLENDIQTILANMNSHDFSDSSQLKLLHRVRRFRKFITVISALCFPQCLLLG
jgi:hypothetical protein